MELNKDELASLSWNTICCLQQDLRLDVTLLGGQSFRWKTYENSNEWIGVVNDDIWILKRDNDIIKFKIINESTKIIKSHIPKKPKLIPALKEQEEKMKDYFHLNYVISDLYKQFNEKDKQFSELFENFRGVRLLRQDPIETLFSFICSSNNNVVRITNMVEQMCVHFGTPIAKIDGTEFYRFPLVSRLAAKNVENILKDLGFGYRAKFIHETATKLLKDHGSDENCREYLYSLRSQSYNEARKELIKFPGVGPKVADCICLMSLDKLNVIPVDTHVRQIAVHNYKLDIKSKSLTESSYKKIATFFQTLWGPYAGWAQSIAFSGQLKMFVKK